MNLLLLCIFLSFLLIFKIFAIRDNFLDFGRFSNLTIYCIAPLRLLVLFEWSIRVNYSLPFICILAELFFVNRIKVGTLNMFSANKKDFLTSLKIIIVFWLVFSLKCFFEVLLFSISLVFMQMIKVFPLKFLCMCFKASFFSIMFGLKPKDIHKRKQDCSYKLVSTNLERFLRRIKSPLTR